MELNRTFKIYPIWFQLESVVSFMGKGKEDSPEETESTKNVTEESVDILKSTVKDVTVRTIVEDVKTGFYYSLHLMLFATTFPTRAILCLTIHWTIQRSIQNIGKTLLDRYKLYLDHSRMIYQHEQNVVGYNMLF